MLERIDALLEDAGGTVAGEIAPADAMLDDPLHYAAVGRSALRCIRLAMLAAGRVEARRVLDMPCGHGRVLRLLRAAFPEAELCGCDIDRAGVDYCARVFGAKAIYSDRDLSRVQLDGTFDLIWVGSLVTHLPRAAWASLFELLLAALEPGGLLVFTTHGRIVAERMRGGDRYGLDPALVASLLDEFARIGFSYADYPGGTKGYGVSLSSLAWIVRELLARGDVRIVAVSEGQWDGHQDVVACQRAGG